MAYKVEKLARFKTVLSIIAVSTLAPVLCMESSIAAPGSVALVVTPSLTDVRNTSDVPQEQGINSDRKLGWGGGVLFDAPLVDSFSLGLGAIFIQRKFQIGTGAVRLERQVPTIFVPLEGKFWLGNIFSIGAGIFGAAKVGDVKDTSVLGGGSLQSTSPADHQTIEYGLTASVNWLIPFADRTGILLGGRYFRGLRNGSKSALYNEKIDDIAFEAGLSFSL